MRGICANFLKAQEWPLTYVYEPQRGISFARNAALNHLPSGCDLVAMLDDDEVPAPDWLDQLLLAQAVTGADVVQGKVVPVFEPETPCWITSGGFFGRPRRSHSLDLATVTDLQEGTCAGTNNVLVRTAAIEELNLSFDPDFALSGGEDTVFFRKLADNGKRIVSAANAQVYEYIPPERANFRYMMVERFRIGNTNVYVERQRREAAAMRNPLRSGVNHVACGLRRLLKTLIGSKKEKVRFALGAFQIAHGLGMITGALGYRHQHYK